MRSREAIDKADSVITGWMGRAGHPLHRVSLGAVFVWFGLLKVFGHKSATSIIAHTVYYGSPDVTVPILGVWEAVIGACLVFRPLVRAAILLLAVRLVGTALALVLKPDVCWVIVPIVPSIEGQYLIKDFILFSAAMVIGAEVRPATGSHAASAPAGR